MKNLSIAIVLFFATIIGVNAQTASTKVQLNVILNPVLSLEIGAPDQGASTGYADVVNLEYKTASDYATGVSKAITGHLKATSIGSGFKISAQAFEGTGQNLSRATGGGAQGGFDGTLVTIALNNSAAKNVRDLLSNSQEMLLSGTNSAGASTSTTGQLIDVTYKSAALNAEQISTYLDNNGNQKVRYTTDVVYTITTP